MHRAAIDVGTNSVKLLVARVDNACVTPLLEDSKQTRLGSGFYETDYKRGSGSDYASKKAAETTAPAAATPCAGCEKAKTGECGV